MRPTQAYHAKLIGMDDVLSLIKSGETIQSGFCANAPNAIFMRLHEIADKVERLRIVTMLDNVDYPFLHMRELAGR